MIRNKKKRVVSFDLDLTLLDHSTMRITQSALEAIDLLREKYYIVLATGRDMTLPGMAKHIEQIRPDAIIHANGAKITLGEELIADYPFPGELTAEVIKVSKENGWCVGAYLGDYAYFAEQERAKEMYTEWLGFCDRKFREAEKLLTKRVYTMLTNECPENLDTFQKRFPQLHLMPFGGMKGADIVRKEVSKRQGMTVLLKRWNLTLEQVVAFGDSYNDMELLKSAGIGVAMGNSDEFIKKKADYVTEDIGDDGVWKACKKLSLI